MDPRKKFHEFKIQGKHRVCNIHLYFENNLQLRGLNLDPFDIIICDGPYGNWPEYGWTDCNWDDYDLKSKDRRKKFGQYYQSLFDVCLKFLKESGSIFIFNYPEGASIIKTVLDDKFSVHFRRWISWFYENHFDFDKGTNFERSHETILYYTRGPENFIFRERNIRDILIHPLVKIESNPFKDGAKPTGIMRLLLDVTYNPGGRLLSLFAGSGTDIFTALEYDMDVVGFEFNPDNFEMLVEKLGKLMKLGEERGIELHSPGLQN